MFEMAGEFMDRFGHYLVGFKVEVLGKDVNTRVLSSHAYLKIPDDSKRMCRTVTLNLRIQYT